MMLARVDLVPRPRFSHLLNEFALAVARRRLCLLGLKLHGAHIHRVTALECRQLLVLLETKGVNSAKTGHLEHIARSHKRLARHIDLDLGALNDGSIGERCQEAAGDEVVELPLRRLEPRGISRRGGIDRRMVGGLGLTPAWR